KDGLLDAWRVHERTRVAAQRLQPLGQVGKGSIREPGAHVARVQEPAVVVVVPDQQGADATLAVAGARVPASDDQLLAGMMLDLEPGPGPLAGLVGAVESLGDHALQAMPAAGLEHDVTVASVSW